MKDEVKEIIKDMKHFVKSKYMVAGYGKNCIKALLDYITELQKIAEEHKNCTRKHWQQKCAEHCANEMIYKSRIDKAIEYIDTHYLNANEPELLNILKRK